MTQNLNLLKKGTQALTKISENPQSDNKDVIIAHLKSGGVIPLNDTQEYLLERWTFADETIRKNLGKIKREEIANIIRERYNVSRATAYGYMTDAEDVFSSSTPLNKAYLCGLRIDFLQEQIRNAAIIKDFKAIAMLEGVLQKYIESYPETKPNLAPRTFIFNIDASNIVEDIPETLDADFIIENSLNELCKNEQ